MNPDVILVHGIWMRGWVEMLPLRRRLERSGFVTHQFSYPSLTAAVEENADRLWRFMQQTGDRPLHLVAHSLGGIVALTALQRHGNGRVQRVVTLGSPLTGSHVAAAMINRPLLRPMLGCAGTALVRGAPPLPADIEIGSIAGTRKLGVGSLFTRSDIPGDGSVTVAETRPAGLRAHLTLPVSHTGLQLSDITAQHTITFLKHGSFRLD